MIRGFPSPVFAWAACESPWWSVWFAFQQRRMPVAAFGDGIETAVRCRVEGYDMRAVGQMRRPLTTSWCPCRSRVVSVPLSAAT